MCIRDRNRIDYFLTLSPGERKRKMDELLGIDRFETARSNVRTIINRFKTEASALKSTLSDGNFEKLKQEEKEVEKEQRETKQKLAEAEKKFLIIEGYLPSKVERKLYPVFWSWYIGIADGWKIPVILTRDERETAFALLAISKRCKKKEFVRPIRARGTTLRERKEDILCCVPGIGRKQARALLDYEPILGKLISLPKEELKKIQGVRAKSIDELYKHFWEDDSNES